MHDLGFVNAAIFAIPLAYVGPALSAGAALVGLVLTVLSAIAALILWPIRRLRRRRRDAAAEQHTPGHAEPAGDLPAETT